jgi:hypothetical protein
MAIVGVRLTGHLSAAERPTKYREAILFQEPNGRASLTGLLSKLKSEMTDDPEFTNFEKLIPSQRTLVAANYDDNDTDITVTTGEANKFRTGDAVWNPRANEVMWVTADPSTPFSTLTVSRAKGSTAAAGLVGDELTIVGMANAENADIPTSISFAPDTVTNYIECFRDPIKISDMAAATYVRTGNQYKELKRETNLVHGMRQEKAYMFSTKVKSTTSNAATYTTGGINYFASTNVTDFEDLVTIDAFEDFLSDIFKTGSKQKICFCGNQVVNVVAKLVRTNANMNMKPADEAFGIKVNRWETYHGTLDLWTHPLFSESTVLDDWGVVVDTGNLRYRFLKGLDTHFRQDVVKDGKHVTVDEFVTYGGLELQFEQNHGVLKNCSALAP